MDRKAILRRYKLVAETHSDIEVKGAKMPYTAINGNMFSFLDDRDVLCLRFSEERKAQLNELHGSGDVLQYGAVMRGYIAVPENVVCDTDRLDTLFQESLAYALTLKPKATKKK